MIVKEERMRSLFCLRKKRRKKSFPVALAVLVIGIGMIELLAMII
jgi:hypothetical protein